MAVIRINKTSDYTVMSNAHFREKEMTLKAKGLLSLMLSLPETWDYSVAGLVALSKDGKDSVMNALSELETFGYLRRTKITDDKGRFAGYDYDIYENPQTGTPQAGKPQQEKPYAENPNTENPQQLNTNISNTNQSNTKEIYMSEFESLWKQYPRKIGKPKALKAYIKARKGGTTFEAVQAGLNAYLQQISANKTETAYIKHGSTWFNGECWNDDYSGGNVPATGAGQQNDVPDFLKKWSV